MPRDFQHLDDANRYVVEDHCANPRFAERLGSPDAVAELENPFCGDYARVELVSVGNVLESVCAIGTGCVICRSSASIMAELIDGCSREEAAELAEQFRSMMSGVDGNDVPDRLGDSFALAGVARFPVRIKCALLPWAALEEALSKVG